MLDDDPWYGTPMTVADEHREWHRLNGPPESTVCPWDCYDPPEPERCDICAEYLHGDEPCSNEDKDWHIESRAAQMSHRLHDSAVALAEKRAEPDEDPWF